jgi:hypothetical protein
VADSGAIPPPPPPDRPIGARPGVVTAAAVLLIIGGAFALLGALILFGVGGSLGGLFVVLGLIFLAVGALQLYAGVQVLGLREQGRKIGIVLAGVAGVLNLVSIAKTPFSSIVGIAIDVFIIWALTQNAPYFRE